MLVKISLIHAIAQARDGVARRARRRRDAREIVRRNRRQAAPHEGGDVREAERRQRVAPARSGSGGFAILAQHGSSALFTSRQSTVESLE